MRAKRLSDRFPRYVLLIIVGIAGVFSIVASGGGGGGNVNLPAAQTPVLETVLVSGPPPKIVPFNPSADWDLLPTKALQLRLRAPWPSNWTVAVDGTSLPLVTDSKDHPELDASGWLRVDDVTAVDASDPAFFWKIFVRLPHAKWNSLTNFPIAVTNVSQNNNLQPAEPLVLNVRPFVNPDLTKPSGVFFAGDNSQDPASVVARDISLAGWLVGPPTETMPERNAPGNARAGETEDFHYDLYLDSDFIVRNYGPFNGAQLSGASIPGRHTCGSGSPVPISLLSGGLNAGTFLMPGTGLMTVELNSWHLPERGSPPAQWIVDPDPAFPKDAWPFAPTQPFGISPPLQPNDYVIIAGTLVEDSAHLCGGDPNDPVWQIRKCWEGKYPAQGGWLEIHPVDSIRTIRGSTGQVGPPQVRKHVNQVFEACDIPIDNQKETFLTPLAPFPGNGFVLRYQEFIDQRFTDMSTVTLHVVEECADAWGPKLHVAVNVGHGGHFKAVYNLWWSQEPSAGTLPVCAKVGTGKTEISMPPNNGPRQ